MDIKKQILQIFYENGIDPSESFQLSEIDSIQYVSVIVEIEQLLEIVLPDYLLSKNEIVDFEGFVNTVAHEYQKKQEQCK